MSLEIILHAFLLLVGFGSVLAGLSVIIKHIAMFRIFREKNKIKYSYVPTVSVIAPVRGLEERTEENVLSLLDQDYKAKWEVIFVVDKDDKKTERKIKEIIKKSKARNAKVIHNKLLENCSGKSAAMISGAKRARYEVIAACDSDALLPETWLAGLVAPLKSKNIGATTGFRFYVPLKFSDYVLSCWNAVGYIAVQSSYPFIWGGGFAIKKSLVKKLSLLGIWSKVISDDSALARKLLHAKLKSYFVPSCIALSYASQFSDLKEFTTRQLTIVRWNWPSAFWTGFFLFLTTRLGIVLGLITLIAYSLTNNFLFLLESFLLLLIIPLELIIANIDFRNFAKMLALEMSMTKWSAAYFVAHWLMAYNILVAMRKKTVKWRGRSYNFADEAKTV